MPIIISLGWNCILKNKLRELNTQKTINPEWNKSLQSLPMDFLQCRDINKVLLAMESKFEGIVDKKYLNHRQSHTNPRTNPNARHITHIFNHELYGFKFMHRFTSLNTDKDRDNIYNNYKNIKEGFDRQTQRFLEFVNSDEKIYFVRYLGALHKTNQLNNLAYTQEHEILSKKLKQLYPNLNYEFIIFRNTKNLMNFLREFVFNI